MDANAIGARLDALLKEAAGESSLTRQNELLHGTLTLLQALYGPESSQERELRGSLERIADKAHRLTGTTVHDSVSLIKGSLQAMKAEVDAGFLGSLRRSITADVLSDLVKLARAVFAEAGESSKDVAAVLAAAAFEDCLRRLADSRALPHQEKLAEVVTQLKDAQVLQGAQVGVAQSYLAFRNRALHAKWTEIGRPEVSSVLGFTEELLLKHFG